MHLSDTARGPSRSAARPDRSNESRPEEVERLQGLMAQIGAEIAGPLTAAIERINTLASTGRIDATSLRRLRDEVEAARQAGMVGQQLTRFASGRIRQSHERLQLADTVANVLSHRQRETQARGVVLKPNLQQAEVVCDGSLLFSLLNATVDWALANAVSPIEFRIEDETRPAVTRLICRFMQRPVDELVDGPGMSVPRSLDSLTWRLLEQTAWAMTLPMERSHETGQSVLSIAFQNSVGGASMEQNSAEIDEGFASSANSQPLAGSHVLVIASRREMRVLIRDALRSMSLIVDFVNTVDEAAAFCREGLPHAVIIEAIQSGERFAHFRQGISAEIPDFVFIEIEEEGRTFQMSGVNGSAVARVGRDVLATSLPSALMFELSKAL